MATMMLLMVVMTLGHVTGINVETPFDEFGNEILGDRLAEMAAMRSTGLGYGYGAQFYFNISGMVSPSGQGRDFPVPQGRGFPQHHDDRFGGNFHQAANAFPHHIFKRQAIPSGELVLSNNPFPDNAFDKQSFTKDFLDRSDFPDRRTYSSDFGSDFHKPTAAECEKKPVSCRGDKRYRNYDGLCNNMRRPYWGATMQTVNRMMAPQYMDGVTLPRLHSRLVDSVTGKYPLLPSARLVSRVIHTPSREDRHLPDVCSMFQQWGQFIDHDMTGTPVHKGAHGEDLKCCNGVRLSHKVPLHSDVLNGGPCFPIYIPPGDRAFGRSCMNFVRSQSDPKRIACGQGLREQMNMVTSYLDASAVYGSKEDDATNLRTYNDGYLKVQLNNLLPTDPNNKDCVQDTDREACFKAGEKRVNEHPGLSTLHTLFHREHNRICSWLKTYNSHWDDEKIYQEARKIVGSLLQHITYNEWLPVMLGSSLMNQYGLHVDSAATFSGFGPRHWYYDDKQDPRIINSFAAAAMRVGHTLVPARFTVGAERVELRKLFNRPKFLYQANGQGVSMVGEGLINDPLQIPDRFINVELTDHLFEDKDKKSMDLAALNINRGRDHGLPPYNDFREACGLSRLSGFHDLPNGDLFASIYRHVDDIDLFTGGITEAPVSGGLAGPTFSCIIAQQFKAIKYGDRYWYENMDHSIGLTHNQLQQIKNVTLARVMCDNLGMSFMQVNAFLQPTFNNQKVGCNNIPYMDLSYWTEPRK